MEIYILLHIFMNLGWLCCALPEGDDEGSASVSSYEAKRNINHLSFNKKKTTDAVKKINNDKPSKDKKSKGLDTGARQVMHAITSKLVKTASDKIAKHVGNIIKSTVASRKSSVPDFSSRRSLSSVSEVVLPALSIAKINMKGANDEVLSSKPSAISAAAPLINQTTQLDLRNSTPSATQNASSLGSPSEVHIGNSTSSDAQTNNNVNKSMPANNTNSVVAPAQNATLLDSAKAITDPWGTEGSPRDQSSQGNASSVSPASNATQSSIASNNTLVGISNNTANATVLNRTQRQLPILAIHAVENTSKRSPEGPVKRHRANNRKPQRSKSSTGSYASKQSNSKRRGSSKNKVDALHSANAKWEEAEDFGDDRSEKKFDKSVKSAKKYVNLAQYNLTSGSLPIQFQLPQNDSAYDGGDDVKIEPMKLNDNDDSFDDRPNINDFNYRPYKIHKVRPTVIPTEYPSIGNPIPGEKIDKTKWNHTQPYGPHVVQEPLQVPPVPAESNPGIQSAVFNKPDIHKKPPVFTIPEDNTNNGMIGHSDFQQEPPIPLHGIKWNGGLTNDAISLMESNSKKVALLTKDVKSVESRLTSVESAIEIMSKGLSRIEKKVDSLPTQAPFMKFGGLLPTIQSNALIGADQTFVTEPPKMPALSHLHHPRILKQFFIPYSQLKAMAAKEEGKDIPSSGDTLRINKVISVLLRELANRKEGDHPISPVQLHLKKPMYTRLPLPQAEVPYPPREHDIDQLAYEIGRAGRTPKIIQNAFELPEQSCMCQNGGECDEKNECICPLRFRGSKCEQPVHRSDLLSEIMDRIPSSESEQLIEASPRKTELITLPLVVADNGVDDLDQSRQKTVGQVSQGKLVDILSQYFNPDYVQGGKRHKLAKRKYYIYPFEKDGFVKKK